jgi:hypothetical protein
MNQPNADLRLKIAQRIHELLQRELAQGIEVPRMLAQPLYARDVLLVCDAVRGSELATLAQQFRDCERSGVGADSQSSGWHDDPSARSSTWPQTWLRPSTWLRGGKAAKTGKPTS